jgi:hypothetical protein
VSAGITDLGETCRSIARRLQQGLPNVLALAMRDLLLGEFLANLRRHGERPPRYLLAFSARACARFGASTTKGNRRVCGALGQEVKHWPRWKRILRENSQWSCVTPHKRARIET